MPSDKTQVINTEPILKLNRGDYHLLVIFGLSKGRIYKLISGKTTIGRDKTAGILLNDRGVSRHHMEVSLENNLVYFSDLNSTNGIYINGEKQQSGNLTTEDYIQIGETVLKLIFFPESSEKKTKSFERTEDVYEYIDKNYHKRLSLTKIAGVYDLDPSYFSTWFKENTGQTFSEYLKQVRISKACELLHQPQIQIIDVSLKSGYNNLSLFNRTFKQLTGMTPSTYRLNHT